jgi:hypothetical protein
MVTKHDVCVSFDIGIVNLGVAAVSVDVDGVGTIIRAETTNIKASSTDASIIKLWGYLDALVHDIDDFCRMSDRVCIHCFIEQQPAKCRSVMHSVELGVRHYFLNLGRTRSVKVKSVSSRSKLLSAIVYAVGATVSQKYRARKQASVSEITGMMGGAPMTLERITAQKADDVCDALLYICRHGGAKGFRDREPTEHPVHSPPSESILLHGGSQ